MGIYVADIFRTRLNRVIRRIHAKRFRSSDYWEKRYAKGGTSGVGSYGRLAAYKAQIINAFVKEKGVQTVIDFGCGDGNQLSYYDIPQYIGLDVSKTAIRRCQERFRGDRSKHFLLYDIDLRRAPKLEKADLTLSIDVLYHLAEDDVFLIYVANLFNYSNKYVIIYSTNFDRVYDSPEQLDREIIPIIEEKVTDFYLVETILNPYKGDETMSDFFIYRKRV